MKKFYILLFAMFFSAGAAFAQNEDELLKQQQQQQQLQQQLQQQQQQQQQQNLLNQQQKEQERLQNQQQKEQERLAKEQAKAQEAAEKKEQDRIKREQAREENAVRKEQKEAKKKAKREENYAKWERKPSITADPYATIVTDRRMYGTNNLYNAVGFNLGAVIDYHLPFAKRLDFNVGLGYRYTNYFYSHLDGNTTGDEQTRSYNSVIVPIKLSRINKDNNHGVYLGLAPGLNFGFEDLPNGSKFNRFRCEFSFGTQSRWLIFSPGFEFYINLMPTYTTDANNEDQIHEFGVRFVF